MSDDQIVQNHPATSSASLSSDSLSVPESTQSPEVPPAVSQNTSDVSVPVEPISANPAQLENKIIEPDSSAPIETEESLPTESSSIEVSAAPVPEVQAPVSPPSDSLKSVDETSSSVIPAREPDSTISAQTNAEEKEQEKVESLPIEPNKSSLVPSEEKPADSTAQVATPQPEEAVSQEQISQEVRSTNPVQPVSEPSVISESIQQQPTSSAEALAKEDIDVKTPDNQVTQVQPATSDDTSSDESKKEEAVEPGSSVEPPESPQMTPTSSPDSQIFSQKSFVDIISGNNPISSQSPLSSDLSAEAEAKEEASAKEGVSPLLSPPAPPKPVSFGDLIKDIEITPPVIPEAERPVEQQQPAPPTQPQPPLQVSLMPVSPVSVPSLLSTQSEVDEKLKTELELRRQKANQVRMAKRQAHLDKLADEVRKKGRLTSTEAQQIFNIPQSTIGDYFQDLVNHGVIKKFGKGRGMYYTM